MLKRIVRVFSALLLAVAIGSCSNSDNDVVPLMPVSINLGDAALWNTYGVSGIGMFRYFIKELKQPEGFFYSENTYTGYGGVLLIGGMSEVDAVPLAYDLSCPVECSRNIRVEVDLNTLNAVCPVCHSVYEVLFGSGWAVAGYAYDQKPRLKLRSFKCIPYGYGGYIIRE